MVSVTSCFPVTAALAATLTMTACDSDSSPADSPESLDILETAAEAGNFETLLAAVEAADLTGTLEGSGPFTVFAPTDEAFDALPDETLNALLEDPEALADVLLYHVVPDQVPAEGLSEGQIVQTAEGREFRVTLDGGPQVNGVDVTQTDIEASNGVIHVVDAVLTPVEDNVDTGVEAGLETLVTAVQAAGLEDALRDPETRLTIFAPSEDAFDALPDGALEDLLDDPEALSEVLLYHVVEGRVFASDLEDGMDVTTLQGGAVTTSLDYGAQVNDASIEDTDKLTSNGVIHRIDEVLLPPDS